ERAGQDLAVTPTDITWTRNGSSPLLSRVTFETSLDGVNYTNAPGAASFGFGSDWGVSGLTLPRQQNIYIRARGYYAGGTCNSSGSITETIKEVFLPPPPQIMVTMPAGMMSVRNHTLTVPVATTTDTTGRGIISYDFTMTYDPAVLTLQATPYDTAGTLSSG